ncbi:MAG: Hsp70 family protein [bacterium]|nr:Hsp70 family protein [bacterium]
MKQTDDFCGFCGTLRTTLELEPGRLIMIPQIGKDRKLVLFNRGVKPLEITFLPAGNAGIRLRFSPHSLEIKAGDNAEITVFLEDAELPADTLFLQPDYVCLVDNDKNKSIPLPITIKAPPKPVALTEIIILSESPDNPGTPPTAEIQNAGGIPLRIADITVEGPAGISPASCVIGAKSYVPGTPTPAIPPGETCRLEFKPTATDSNGRNAASAPGKGPRKSGVRITFKNSADSLFIPIRDKIPPYHLQAVPNSIEIPEALSKENYCRAITLFNDGLEHLEITALESSNPDWLHIVSESPHFMLLSHNTNSTAHGADDDLPAFNREFRFEILIFPATLPQGKQKGKIRIHTAQDTGIEICLELDVLHPTACDEYIGIDFGTSNSVVAIRHEGDIIVVKDKKSDSALIPSLLVFHGRPDNYRIGMEAEKEADTYPEMSVRSIKRVMGYGNERTFFDKKFWPEDLAALIIKKLVEYAERSLFELNRGRPDAYYDIRKAIVTVPANFYDLQIRGILEACEKAGIDTEEAQVKEAAQKLKDLTGHDINEGIILDEPTAAALFFLKMFQESGTFEDEFDRKFKDNENINLLVFDYGGGTLDVSVVQVIGLQQENGAGENPASQSNDIGVRALANKGDNRIGGDSIDLAVMSKLLGLCKEEFPDFDPSLLRLNYPQLEERKRKEKWSAAMWAETMGIRAMWKKKAEQLKIDLSQTEEASFEITGDCLIAKNGDQLHHIDGVFKKKVTRKMFTGWIRGILEKSKTLINEALALSELEDTDIDYIIHTGRSSLMPQIRETVREALPSVDKDHDVLYEEHLKVCVARGAVIYALLRSEVCIDQGVRIVSGGRKLPHSYGIQVNKGFKQLFEPIIPRSATYPVKSGKSYPTVPGRPLVQVRFLQNSGTDNRIHKDNTDIREIGSLSLDTRKNGKPGYEVAFVIDANRKIEVWADNEEVIIRPARLEDDERWIC